MTKSEAINRQLMEQISTKLSLLHPVESEELSFEDNECREHELKYHLEHGSVQWKDLLLEREIITTNEYNNYNDGEI